MRFILKKCEKVPLTLGDFTQGQEGADRGRINQLSTHSNNNLFKSPAPVEENDFHFCSPFVRERDHTGRGKGTVK